MQVEFGFEVEDGLVVVGCAGGGGGEVVGGVVGEPFEDDGAFGEGQGVALVEDVVDADGDVGGQGGQEVVDVPAGEPAVVGGVEEEVVGVGRHVGDFGAYVAFGEGPAVVAEVVGDVAGCVVDDVEGVEVAGAVVA